MAAALATAVLAVLVPAAGTAAPELDRAALLRELNAAIADEERALQLLAKSPPRKETAALALERSSTRLRKIGDAVSGSSLQNSVRRAVVSAAGLDDDAVEKLRKANVPRARSYIELALRLKMGGLSPIEELSPLEETGDEECSDGRDNDGDGTVDARYDSGCTNAKDDSERSPLTCSLGYAPSGGAYVVKGTCSGPFFKIEISAPVGAKFDTKRAPVVVQDRACWYPSERRVDCVMGDGAANPRHVVNYRWYELGRVPAARRLTVTIIDFGGGRRIFVLPLAQAPPPAEPAFSLGKEPVAAVGTFNGQDVCQGLATSFTQASQWLAPGTGTLTITDATGRKVSGPIERGGSFDVRGSFAFSGAGESFSESYVGKITGATATATYKYTNPSGCLSTYAVSFVLQR